MVKCILFFVLGGVAGELSAIAYGIWKTLRSDRDEY